MHDFLDGHYRRTLDEPVPMLDGQTLCESAATKSGHGEAIDWLKQLKNIGAVQQGHQPYDATWIWRELGIWKPSR